MKEGTLSRIKKYLDYKGISNRAFEMQFGFSNGSFASQLKNEKTIGVDRLENILNEYTDINVEWLLTGKGSMLRDSEPKDLSEDMTPNFSDTQAGGGLYAKYTDEQINTTIEAGMSQMLLEMYQEGRIYSRVSVENLMTSHRETLSELTKEINFLRAQLERLQQHQIVPDDPLNTIDNLHK